MDPKRECLYDVEWQLLRVELLDSWHSDPEGNILKLLKYLGEGRGLGEYEQFVRTWRCLNLLKAVPLTDDKTTRKALLKGRQGFQIRYDKLISYGHRFRNNWDWKKVRGELGVVLKDNPAEFKLLKQNLEGRMKKVGMNSSVPYMQAKPEAAKFIRLMRDVEFESETTR